MNIVLVNPQIPQNTGNIARTCAAVGAALHLVKPLGFSTDDKSLKRAGLDYWHLLKILYYDDLEDFLSRNDGSKMFFFTTKARRCYSEMEFTEDCFLIFGSETEGLPEELLISSPETCCRIPMIEDSRSLNLSNSAAIAVYEALRQTGFSRLKKEGSLRNFDWPG
jgi:tRNA (cytidine/uridine-2'-O-)-methyltransferase